MARSKEIREFAQDVYDYIWSRQKFLKKGVQEKFAEGFSLRCSSTNETKVTNFTKGLGKAVRITQYLLRDYFHHFFQFVIPDKEVFKKDVKLMWSHWLDNRENIFVKVIDTLAIVAESFMFSDSYEELNYELNDMTEWFIEWFEEHLASEFFKNGGWKTLNDLAFDWYNDLFENVYKKLDLWFSITHSECANFTYSVCDIVNHLRHSPVKFPVPESVISSKNKFPFDEKQHRRTVYARLSSEFEVLKSKSSSYRKNLPVEVQRKVKCEDMKNKQFSTKLEHTKDLTTETLPTVQNFQTDEIPKDCGVENSKNLSIVQSSSQFPTVSKICTKGDGGIQVDSRTSIGDISKEDLSDNNHTQISTTSDFQLGFHSAESLSKNENLKSKQSTEILNGTFEQLKKLYALTKSNYLKEQTHITAQSVSEEVKESKATSDVEADSLLSAENKLNFFQESTPQQAEDVSVCTEQSTIPHVESEYPSLSLPESSDNLKQTLATGPIFESKEVLKTSLSAEDTKNDKAPISPSHTKTCSYEQFVETLLQSNMNKDCQIEGPKDQNKFYLISDLFSNSFKKLFESYRTNTLEEKLNTLIISESLISTVPEDIKSEQQTHFLFNLPPVKLGFSEYRFYLIGEEQKFEPVRKSRRRRSNK